MLTPRVPWLPAWRLGHAWLLSGAALVCATAGFALSAPSREAQLAWLAGGVALLALPHGAVDPWVGAALVRRFGRARWWVFGAGYLGLAAAVVAVWIAAPAWALLGFLGVSMLHFGLEDRERGLLPEALDPLDIATRGALPIAAPLLFHPAETAELFALLVPAEAAAGVRSAALLSALPVGGLWLSLLIGGGVVHLGYLGLSRDPRHVAVLAELSSLLLLFVALPPLLAFGVCFCLGHSVRHALGTAAGLDPYDPRRALLGFAARALPLTLVTVVAGLVGWSALSADASTFASGARVVFVGLAALTAPHVALAAWSAARPPRLGSASRRPPSAGRGVDSTRPQEPSFGQTGASAAATPS